MKRSLGIVLVVVVAAAIAYLLTRNDDSGAASVAAVERCLTERRFDDARRELAAAAGRVDAATHDYLEGAIALSEGRDAAAEPPFVRARAARPEDWRIVGGLASVWANTQRLPAARQLVADYVAKHPGDERALATEAQLWLAGPKPEHQAQKALDCLDRIAALATRMAPPGDPTAIADAFVSQLRAQAESELGHARSALDEARVAAARNPRDPEAWFIAGETARRAEKPEEALDDFRRAIALAPRERRYGEQLVLAILALQGSGPEALAVTQSLLANTPQDPALRVLLARSLVRCDRYDEANDVYIDLQKRADVPLAVKKEVLRNRAMLLYDWKGGGKAGDFLEDAYQLLVEYQRLGGEIDEKLRAAWEDLQEIHRKKAEGGK